MVKIFLSGVESFIDIVDVIKPKYILLSYYSLFGKKEDYLKKLFMKIRSIADEVMLDSGGYTFIMDVQRRGKKNFPQKYFDNYYEAYLRFLEKYGNFFDWVFELDLDILLGTEWVENWWQKAYDRGIVLSKVFHKRQGFEVLERYIKSDCEMIGMPIRREYKESEFLKIAKYVHDKGKKFHGLAYTPKIKRILDVDFIYSVDSTSWLSGCRVGKGEDYILNKKWNETKKINKFGWKLLVELGLINWKKYQDDMEAKK